MIQQWNQSQRSHIQRSTKIVNNTNSTPAKRQSRPSLSGPDTGDRPMDTSYISDHEIDGMDIDDDRAKPRGYYTPKKFVRKFNLVHLGKE
eukprot:UN00522